MWLGIEPLVKELAHELDNSMEVNHFLANLNNLVAIQLALHIGARCDLPEQAEPERGMTRAQRTALAQYLDNYPDDAGYEDVLKLFAAGWPGILVWAPFEHEAPADVVEYIEALRMTLEATYGRD